MSLRLRFFALDADEGRAGFSICDDATLDAVAAAVPAPVGAPIVPLAVLSASDVDEDRLRALCSVLESATGQDFTSAARSVVPTHELASFADAVRRLELADPAPGWLAALRHAVDTCRAGQARLGWDLLWDQAGVTDGPDEQPTAATTVPAGQVAGAIDAFGGLTAGDDGR